MVKKRFLFTLLLCLHSLWMMFLAYLWLNLPFSYDWESYVITGTNIFKNIVLKADEKPSKDSVLFINISYDKQLIPRLDQDGFESGKVAVTDRNALAKFFEVANATPEYKWIILDIFFEDSTAQDSLLQAHLNKSDRIILPYHLDGGKEALKSFIIGWNGLADYNADFGNFLKYNYLQKDTNRTVPLKLYERFDKGRITKHGPFYTSNGHLALNSLTLDFPVRSYDVFTNDSLGYSSVHLCELMNLPPPVIQQMLKNRTIVIGDFTDLDIHPTVYGSMAGPLIQFNAYLALKNRDHELPWSLLLFVFLNFFVISWFLFTGTVLVTSAWLERLKNGRKTRMLYEFLKYAFFLILINILSYLLFDVHLNVLVLGIYIVGVELLLDWLKIKFDKKRKINI